MDWSISFLSLVAGYRSVSAEYELFLLPDDFGAESQKNTIKENNSMEILM